ncbi:SDR family oxidoreductase [Trinickia terrae]|uniref:SDR family oxidoreductase n=1 Tax=Trinickia terrae TaxID=2571161 RepID=A0A4U1HN10_9BURK|nr:SDR family NAD(P)-dependent oxidoreductase [Trinickia terrae]TKC80166.1 SDR family oxidoreductase [Trinickia terrae]
MKKVALITGAARGIGQAFAQRLARDGFVIALLDRLDCQDTAELVREAGSEAHIFLADLSEKADIDRVAADVHSRLGGIDVLVNNAGILPNKSFDEITVEDYRLLMAINLDAPFWLTHALVGNMRAKGWGRVINIASNTFGAPIKDFTHYIASKMGLIGLTRALASELGVSGITVNAVAPGLTKTPWMLAPGRRGPGGLSYEDESKLVVSMQSIPRAQTPEDLVGVVSFLSSKDADFISGQTIVVDGGLIRV